MKIGDRVRLSAEGRRGFSEKALERRVNGILTNDGTIGRILTGCIRVRWDIAGTETLSRDFVEVDE